MSLYIYPIACIEGYFGTNCSRKCSTNCKSDTCRHTDGWCKCAADLTPDNCTTGDSIYRIFTISIIPIGKNKDRASTFIQIVFIS